MTQLPDSIWSPAESAWDAEVDARAGFIRKTYLHLLGAVLGFAVLEYLLFQLGAVQPMMSLLGASKWSWLIVLGAFMAVSWIASAWANSSTSLAMQYAGLILYVVAEAVIFVPILYIASTFYEGAITTAATTTLIMFGGITAFAFISGKNFSFLGGVLTVCGIAAMITIGLAIVMGFELGLIFTVLMIAFASMFILYETSNVMHQYRVGQHVAASLALFASVALLFWYVLRLVMSFSSED